MNKLQDELTDEQILDVMRSHPVLGKTFGDYEAELAELLGSGMLAKTDHAPWLELTAAGAARIRLIHLKPGEPDRLVNSRLDV